MRVRRLRNLALIASFALAIPCSLALCRPILAETTPPVAPTPSTTPGTPTTPGTKTAPSTPPTSVPTPVTPGTTAAPATPGAAAPPAPAGETKTPTETAKPPAADSKPPAADSKPPAAESKPPAAAAKPEEAVPPADGKPHDTEIEPNGSPGVPTNATTESVDVPSRPVVMVGGQSSYDDAFKSIKASIETVKAAMEKAGLKPSGHPVTIFSEPDDKGFKYKSAIPIAEVPSGKPDLGANVTIGQSPSGRAIKFQHRGAYDDIDSTYDVITAYLDAKGLQVDNPYIEEYLTDLTTNDDPNLQVDIYVFVKK